MSQTSLCVALALAALLVIGCKDAKDDERETLQSEARTFFQANMMDSTASLDSFRIVSIDTITQKMLLIEQSSMFRSQIENLLELYKLTNQSLSASVDQMRLYKMIESKDLMEIERDDFKKKSEKGDLLKAELDTLMSIINHIDSTSKTADSVNAIGFQAKCFYQTRAKDKSVKRDTSFVILNSNKDIVKRSDFLRMPYTVDFEKFR